VGLRFIVGGRTGHRIGGGNLIIGENLRNGRFNLWPRVLQGGPAPVA
jgi:hypothetical protein